MNMSGVRHITGVSLKAARSCFRSKRYGRAFANYLLFLKLAPERKEEILDDFILCMRLWTECLEKDGRIEDIFKSYDQACEILSDSEALMNNIGAQLFRLGYVEEAAMYIHKSIQINPNYLAAKENLENICSHLVERWHFRMLNDQKRNMAYRKAIQAAVESGFHTVLDIGTGTGILSLMALEAGATEITACEKSKTMCQIAESVIRENKGVGRINLLCEPSTNLSVPEYLPDKVSLVVTETFDAALFGENIVNTLQHAWRELLIPARLSGQRSKVIPYGATVYVCAIESETIRSSSRFLYPGLHCLDFGDVELVCSSGSCDQDPYTTENLSRLHRGYRTLSEPVQLTAVNFCDPTELDTLASGMQWLISLPIKSYGKLDAIALWFDLHLGAEITVTTNPSTDNCWEQAVFPLTSSNFNKGIQHSYVVREGDMLQANFSLNDSCLKLDSCCQASETKEISNSDKKVTKSIIYRLEDSDIVKLNNLYCNKLYLQAIEKQTFSLQPRSVLDYCGGLSPLCLQMLKGGAVHGTMVLREDLHDIVKKLAQVNNIDTEKLFLFEQTDIGDIHGHFDVILCDLIEPCGILRQQILEDIALLRATCQTSNGVVIPGRVTVLGLCIESEMLLADSAVIDDKKTMGFQIAKFMNDFRMTTHVDIDLSTLQHTRLSDPFTLMNFDLNEGLCDDQPLSFLEQSLEVKVTSVDAGILTAVVYWFDIELGSGIRLSTLDTNSHWKQAAVMLKNHTELVQGQDINFKVNLKNSCISVKLDNDYQSDD